MQVQCRDAKRIVSKLLVTVRNSRTEDNTRAQLSIVFKDLMWLSRNQIRGYFSRLSKTIYLSWVANNF